MSISNEQRQLVRERARNCCEYCRLSHSVRLARFHVDHVVAIKHGGTARTINLMPIPSQNDTLLIPVWHILYGNDGRIEKTNGDQNGD